MGKDDSVININCRKCVKNIEAVNDDLCTCENCGAVHSIAGYDSNICSRLNLAVKFRIAGEFANAEASYGFPCQKMYFQTLITSLHIN